MLGSMRILTSMCLHGLLVAEPLDVRLLQALCPVPHGIFSYSDLVREQLR